LTTVVVQRWIDTVVEKKLGCGAAAVSAGV
jgi:hypothetical protein